MPALIDAESRGVFKGPAVSAYYLAKAARDSDHRAEWVDTPLPAQEGTEASAPAAQMPQPVASSRPSMKELRAEMKERGLNSFGKGRAQIEAELSDAQSDGAAES